MRFASVIQRALWSIILTGFLGISQAADFTVNQVFDGADATPGDGLCATVGGSCTLRAAVMETNALVGADSIVLPAGTYSLKLGNTGEDAAAEGDLDILDDLTITGADAATTTVNGNSFKYRIFSILKRVDDSLPVVAINRLTLTQGLSDANGALIYNAGELALDDITLTDASPDSRAMVNEGDFTLNNSRVNNNERGIYSKIGDAVITNSEFTNNVSTATSGSAFYLYTGTAVISNTVYSNNTSRIGGAIYNNGGLLNLHSCQFNGNIAIYPSYSSRGRGGAVFSGGDINISNSTFETNQSENDGGALYLEGSFSNIIDSNFSNNIATDGGGGIYANLTSDSLRVKRITMNGNQAANDGGGIFVSFTSSSDRFWLSESILNNNTAGNVGGGIVLATSYKYRDFNPVLRHIEISNNTASYGGGIYTSINGGTLQNITIADNIATIDGGGLYQNANSDKFIELVHLTIAYNTSPVSTGSNVHNESGVIRLNNTLIANSVGGQNCTGSITTLGYNLSSDSSCGLGVEGDQSGTDPLLSALADNGGITKTHALQAGSPAIDGGSAVACATLNPIDQRYYYRSDSICDIGAFEYGSVLAQTGTLSFSTNAYSVNEADVTATVTVSRTGGSEGFVSVPYFDTEKGTAGGGDYDAIDSVRLEWADGDSSNKTVDITINDDTSFEDNETILLALKNEAFVYGGASLGIAATTVTIVDNEVPGEVQFSSAEYLVDEDGSSIEIIVERLNGNTAVSIDYTTGDGSAVAGTDYTVASGTLNFSEGQTSKAFYVDITDNADIDGSRTINLTLNNPQDGLVLGAPVTAVLTIEDDETGGGTGELQFANADIFVNETDGSATATVTRTNGSTGTVSVDYIASPISAINGSDYSLTAGTLTFADGVTSQTITFSIIDDALLEGDEEFWIDLENPTGDASLGANWYTLVTITDDETGGGSGGTGELQFASTDIIVNETDGTATATVTRTNGSTGTISVDYFANLESITEPATNGSDYSLAAGTLTFADGVTSQTITFSIIDDALLEGDEEFWIDLENPAGGASLGADWFTLVTITDDETATGSDPGTVAFDEQLYPVTESDSTLTYTLLRTGGIDGVVSVDVTFENENALFGTDYNADSQSFTVTFQDGESSFTGTVSIIDDSDVEIEEFFKIRLSNPQGGVTIAQPDYSLAVIADNDSSSGGDSGSGDSSGGGGGGALNPLLLFGLLLVPVMRRRRQH